MTQVNVPPPGKAKVYFVRSGGFVGGAAGVQVKIDNTDLGRLGIKTFLCAFVDPGTHEVQTVVCPAYGGRYPENRQSFKVDVGDVLYMKGRFAGVQTHTFKPVCEQEGLKLINSYKQTDNESSVP